MSTDTWQWTDITLCGSTSVEETHTSEGLDDARAEFEAQYQRAIGYGFIAEEVA